MHALGSRSWPRLLAAATTVMLVTALNAARSQAPDVTGAAARSRVPTDVAALVKQVQAALDGSDNRALQSSAQTPGTLNWLDLRSRPGRPRWKFASLALPVRPGEHAAYAGIFYDYHTCESINDHIHKLVSTAGGWKIGPEIPETDTLGYRVRDHRLTVHLDPHTSSCLISDVVTIERTTAAPGSLCLLRLSSVMHLNTA